MFSIRAANIRVCVLDTIALYADSVVVVSTYRVVHLACAAFMSSDGLMSSVIWFHSALGQDPPGDLCSVCLTSPCWT